MDGGPVVRPVLPVAGGDHARRHVQRDANRCPHRAPRSPKWTHGQLCSMLMLYYLVPVSAVCHKFEFCRNGGTDQAGFWRTVYRTPLILHGVISEFIVAYLQNKGTSLWSFVADSDGR